MVNGLTKHGNCRTSCFYGGDNLKACTHPDYVKAVNEGRKCPEDPRTEQQIRQDVEERKHYFKIKGHLQWEEQYLDILTVSEEKRNKLIKRTKKRIKQIEKQIRQYESKNQ